MDINKCVTIINGNAVDGVVDDFPSVVRGPPDLDGRGEVEPVAGDGRQNRGPVAARRREERMRTRAPRLGGHEHQLRRAAVCGVARRAQRPGEREGRGPRRVRASVQAGTVAQQGAGAIGAND